MMRFCGNVLTSAAESAISCCGRKLLSLEAQKADDEHRLTIEAVEDESALYCICGTGEK